MVWKFFQTIKPKDMSTWRQKAIECAPGLKKNFNAKGLTPYSVFMELLPLAREAHIIKDNKTLQSIYDYAEWCFRQKDQKLWNAAGVSFYEHLGDTPETFPGFTKWVKKDIYLDIRELLDRRCEDSKMKELDNYYGLKGLNNK